MTRNGRAAIALHLCLLSASLDVRARAGEAPPGRPFLHAMFTDNMVLQRGVAAPVWGWTEPGRRVTVALNGIRVQAVADDSGRWTARLGPLPAGGPYTMIVTGPRSATLSNVMVGDVWLCSGQSNMQMALAKVSNGPAEVARADYPQIRLFTVPMRTAFEPEATSEGRWLVCSPRSVSATEFSAVAYFFGQKLHAELKVPIGLINASWSGTVAEAWASAEALKTIADFRADVAEVEQAVADRKRGLDDFEVRREAWWRRNDPGSAALPGWADPALDDSGWKTMNLPGYWEEAGLPGFDGIVWFRKELNLPGDWPGKDLVLHLGPIDDADTTWVNGTRVGGKDAWGTARVYKVPHGLLRAGRNVVAVRVHDKAGPGGFSGSSEQLKLEPAGGSQGRTISLAGAWRYRASTPRAGLTPLPRRLDDDPNVATVLFNGMIAPLIPYAIKGAIWYQGESNVGRALQYRTLLPTLIRDWRSRFGSGEFPFLIVQLANFLPTRPEPGESAWAELREAQWLTTKAVPRTALAVAIDLGETGDIHPRNKQEVGRRLALGALAVAYGRPVEFSGPTFRALRVEGNTARLSFGHLGGGLVARGGGPLQGFAVAGADKQFVWAEAVIDGDEVVVSSPRVARPAAVRYAWADNPVCNLANKAGLPAVPFRTDVSDK
jgi:sialate O-acetylesterase